MPLLDMSFDEASFSGEVPLFPLPQAVLLPGALAPLHVFEPRYRALVRDALAGDRLLGLALLLPGYEADYEGCPPIDPTVCVGRIVLDAPLDDGRFNILVAGLRRARTLGEDRSRAYRRAHVELLPDVPLAPDRERAETARLIAMVEGLPVARVRHAGRLATALQLLASEVPAALSFGAALDLVADALELDSDERMAILREPDVARRLAALGRIAGEDFDPPTPAFWRAGFSRN